MPVGSGSWCYYESQARKFLPLGEKLKTDEQIRRSRLELYHVIYLNVFLSLAWSCLPFVSFILQQEIPPVSQEILQ